MADGIAKVGVIGAGAMGAGIAAIVANAGIPVLLLDIPAADQGDSGPGAQSQELRNRPAQAGLERIRPVSPAELFLQYRPGRVGGMPTTGLMNKAAADLITIGNLEDDFEQLADADWIVEAIIEKIEPKRELMQRLEGVRQDHCLISTNTSGLPVASLAEGRSAAFKSHFLGTHFFNPPRRLPLLEIIALPESDPAAVRRLVDFAEYRLGKKIVYCHDTPNFIANRIVAVTIAQVAEYALQNGYTIAETDLLTGTLIGRTRTATFLLQDWVGVDVVGYVTDNLYRLIPDDPQRELLVAPRITGLRRALLQNGRLGNKSGRGFYQ